jgi:hypothetical protein
MSFSAKKASTPSSTDANSKSEPAPYAKTTLDASKLANRGPARPETRACEPWVRSRQIRA